MMKEDRQFQFIIHPNWNQISVSRIFDAPFIKVWDAWTNATILDQWWAPAPFKAVTKRLDFIEGGEWLYAMVGIDGSEQWSKAKFLEIKPLKCIIWKDAFCDRSGNIDSTMPTSTWKIQFLDADEKTEVKILIQLDSLKDLEKNLEMGFEEGLSMGFDNLDHYLKA